MKNKLILITGGMGFIGREVARQLLRKSYDVLIVDNLSQKNVDQNLIKYVKFIKGDLSDRSFTRKAFQNVYKCIHLAGISGGVGYLNKYPATILTMNNQINSSVLDACVYNKVERLVFISSSMVFESSNKFPLDEKHLDKIPIPKSPYGLSKLMGELSCKFYYQQFGLNYVILRLFNAYGINELPNNEPGISHVIPDLAKKIISEQYPLKIIGDGKQTRCFTHIKDISRAIVMATESNSALNTDFIIGNNSEISILDLAKIIWGIAKRKEKFKYECEPGYKYDVKRCSINISKAKEILGWEPRISLENGLPEVIHWLEEVLKY